MIIHSNFLWLHLPRSAGTTTSSWLRKIDAVMQLDLNISPQDKREKHDNLLIRNYRLGCLPESKAIVMNFRSLPEWLISNYYFALSSGMSLPLDRYISGEFFSLRVGKWCHADWWLDYFEVNKVSHFMNVKNLENDWRAFLNEVCNLQVPDEIRMQKENEITEKFKYRPLMNDFDWTEAFLRNPKWLNLENKVLGKVEY